MSHYTHVITLPTTCKQAFLLLGTVVLLTIFGMFL